MESLLLIVGGLMIVATLLPLLPQGMWWIRVFDFPRLQVAVISAVTLAAYIYLTGAESNFQRLFIAALAGCILRQCYMIFPYTPLARQQVERSRQPEGEASCRLLFANVLMTNRNTARLREIIRRADPDVILTVETDRWWQTELREFEATHPHLVHQPQENTYGMLLYSRLELINPEVKFIVEDDIPSIHTLLKLPNGTVVELHCLHPRPPFPTEAAQSTERDAELLIVGRSIKATATPTIVMGDLNDVAWSHTNYLFQDISGLLDPRIGRGFFNTFHAQLPGLRFPLDHFFHSNHFRLIELKKLPRFGSDHFPVLVALSYEPDAPREQEELQADDAQNQEAQERIEEAAQTTSANVLRRGGPVALLAGLSLLLAGCGGPQSALDPAGREAERIADLFWWMTMGAVIVWLAMIGLALYAVRSRPETLSPRRARLFIVWGGAVVPTVILTVLLIYGLAPIPALLAPAPAGSLKIAVSGEQWWWRVRYEPLGGAPVMLANEIRLPVGEPVEFQLESPDVIHSFWIPSLAGKVDMIPGRVTRLALMPTRTGVFRGACAEYCGASHALMSFQVEVMGKEEFTRWLAHQAQPAQPVDERGQQLFLSHGCGACHTIRGTPARGVIGPDLTHVGGRLSLAAATLPNGAADFRRWIAHTDEVKPGALMPKFGMLPPEDLQALAVYLDGLQ